MLAGIRWVGSIEEKSGTRPDLVLNFYPLTLLLPIFLTEITVTTPFLTKRSIKSCLGEAVQRLHRDERDTGALWALLPRVCLYWVR